MRDWYVGQKVVCVKYDRKAADAAWIKIGNGNIVIGETYTIRRIVDSSNDAKYVAFELYEIINPVAYYSDGYVGEANYDERCFRPVVSDWTKTDISVFTNLLDHLPVKEKELERI